MPSQPVGSKDEPDRVGRIIHVDVCPDSKSRIFSGSSPILASYPSVLFIGPNGDNPSVMDAARSRAMGHMCGNLVAARHVPASHQALPDAAQALSASLRVMPSSAVVILGAARTPIRKVRRRVESTHPAELGAVAARAALERAGVNAADVQDVWFGHARQAVSGPNPPRQVGEGRGDRFVAPPVSLGPQPLSAIAGVSMVPARLLEGEFEPDRHRAWRLEQDGSVEERAP
jgi:hypothetical protein